MRSLLVISVCFLSLSGMSQKQRKVSGYLSFQYTKTIKDLTKGNNPWGLGIGTQAYYNTGFFIRPELDITADIYPEDDKTLLLIRNESLDKAGAVINVFGGIQCTAAKIINLGFVMGPSFINGSSSLGIKPSLGFYLSEKQKCELKVSYINITKRNKKYPDDFTSWSLGFAAKIF